MSRPAHRDATVAYLTKRFPRLSETFILDEILGLEEAGVPLRLYAGGDPGEAVTQPDVALVASTVTYLHEAGAAAALRRALGTLHAHGRLLIGDPARYLRALAHLLASPNRRTVIGHFATAGRLVALLRRDGARHVHAAFAHSPASIAHYAHLLSGLPFSFAGHAKDIYTSDPRSLAARAAAAEFVMVCSASAAAELERRTGDDARIVLAYHGVDSRRFTPSGDRAEQDEPVRILAVGRLVEKKGYPILIDALAAVAASGRRLSCEIVGTGSAEAALREQIARRSVGDLITLAGALTHQQIAAHYRRCDVFVQASVVLGNGDRDGVPNSLLEAMASGLAVVASDVAGIPEVIEHGVTGLLVAPADVDALAEALTAVIDDAELRRHLGAGAREHVVARLDRRVCCRELAAMFGVHEGLGGGAAIQAAPARASVPTTAALP
jgi:glycosyltransferase involved in cell wall biosynthesis